MSAISLFHSFEITPTLIFNKSRVLSLVQDFSVGDVPQLSVIVAGIHLAWTIRAWFLIIRMARQRINRLCQAKENGM